MEKPQEFLSFLARIKNNATDDFSCLKTENVSTREMSETNYHTNETLTRNEFAALSCCGRLYNLI